MHCSTGQESFERMFLATVNGQRPALRCIVPCGGADKFGVQRGQGSADVGLCRLITVGSCGCLKIRARAAFFAWYSSQKKVQDLFDSNGVFSVKRLKLSNVGTAGVGVKQVKYCFMKKIIASFGLVALSASSLQALNVGMASDTGRFWSVSAALRGFYDDNINTISEDVQLPPGSSRESFGFEVSPAVFLNFPLEQTTIGLSYVYDFKYYDKRPWGQTENYDMTHVFNAAVNHAFSERYQLSAKDSFAIGQEPDLLRAGNTYNTFQRIPGDNLRNYGVVNFSAQITPTIGADLGYGNTLFRYADDESQVDSNGNIIASNAGLLDIMDQTIHLDGRVQIQPQTIGVLGYQFRMLDYTADQPIGGNVYVPLSILMSDIRNVHGHYIYGGLDHNFRPDLTGSFRVGGMYNEYYNNSAQNNWSPYALVSLRYTYNPGSYVEAGFTYDFTSGNNFTSNTRNDLTMGAYAASLYGVVHHQITRKLAGSIMLQYQNDLYYGGSIDDFTQEYFLAYIGLEYQITRYFSAQVGYNYDNVWGDLDLQNYDRNRVYIGVTASY